MENKKQQAKAEINKMFDEFMEELRKNVLNIRRKKSN